LRRKLPIEELGKDVFLCHRSGLLTIGTLRGYASVRQLILLKEAAFTSMRALRFVHSGADV
jgi:hypothetical protein